MRSAPVARQWLHLVVPRDNPSAPLAAEQLYAAIHAGMGNRERTHLLLVGVPREVGIYLDVETHRVDPVVAMLRATYPDLDVVLRTPPSEDSEPGPHLSMLRWTLAGPSAYPVKTVREFTDSEPMAMTLGALAEARLGEFGAVSLVLQRAPISFHRRATELANLLAAGCETSAWWERAIDTPMRFLGDALSGVLVAGPAASTGANYRPADVAVKLAALQAKNTRPAFAVTLRTVWWAGSAARAEAGQAGLLAALGQFTVIGQNQFVARRSGRPARIWAEVRASAPRRRPRTVLGVSELAGLVHLPGPDLVVPHLMRTGARQRAARRVVDPTAPGVLVLAESAHRGGGEPVALRVTDLLTHAYVIGPSGTGKTTLLTRLVLELARTRTAAVVLDPHGDLARQVLTRLPEEFLDRVDLFDLADPASLPSVNPLWVPAHPATGEAVARSIRSAAVTACFADLWGLHRAITPNLLHFLEAALATLIASGSGTLAQLPRFLTDAGWRQEVLFDVSDPRLTARWREFAALSYDDRSRTVRAILNKAADFDRNPILATVFGEPGPGLRLTDVMDHGRVLIVSLPRGLVPEGTVQLVGALLVTLLYQAALAREDRHPDDRPPVVAVIDEFQEFGLTAFAQVITAARKYGLGLVVANQNLARIQAVNPEVLATLVANVGTLVTFRLAPADADYLAPLLTPFDATDLVTLGPHEVYLRLPSPAGPHVIAGRTLPPEDVRCGEQGLADLASRLRLPGSPLASAQPVRFGDADRGRDRIRW